MLTLLVPPALVVNDGLVFYILVGMVEPANLVDVDKVNNVIRGLLIVMNTVVAQLVTNLMKCGKVM